MLLFVRNSVLTISYFYSSYRGGRSICLNNLIPVEGHQFTRVVVLVHNSLLFESVSRNEDENFYVASIIIENITFSNSVIFCFLVNESDNNIVA